MAKLAAVDHAVCGEMSRSNCTGQARGETTQVVARASGEDGDLKRSNALKEIRSTPTRGERRVWRLNEGRGNEV